MQYWRLCPRLFPVPWSRPGQCPEQTGGQRSDRYCATLAGTQLPATASLRVSAQAALGRRLREPEGQTSAPSLLIQENSEACVLHGFQNSPAGLGFRSRRGNYLLMCPYWLPFFPSSLSSSPTGVSWGSPPIYVPGILVSGSPSVVPEPRQHLHAIRWMAMAGSGGGGLLGHTLASGVSLVHVPLRSPAAGASLSHSFSCRPSVATTGFNQGHGSPGLFSPMTEHARGPRAAHSCGMRNSPTAWLRLSQSCAGSEALSTQPSFLAPLPSQVSGPHRGLKAVSASSWSSSLSFTGSFPVTHCMSNSTLAASQTTHTNTV